MQIDRFVRRNTIDRFGPVREVVHGRPIKNREALANPEALEFFRDRPELRA